MRKKRKMKKKMMTKIQMKILVKAAQTVTKVKKVTGKKKEK